jgi:hypothetical protein
MGKLKIVIFTLLTIFLIIFLFYLLLPSPKISPLPYSLRSQEEGDTWQVQGVSGYYTNLKRDDVLNYYQQSFALPFFKFLPLNYRLNQPPEYARQVIRDEITVSYFEEIVHPFRETLMVTGFEPSVLYKDKQGRIVKEAVIVGGKNYFSKVTIRYLPNPVWKRLFFFLFSVVSIGGLFVVWKRIFKSGWNLNEKF